MDITNLDWPDEDGLMERLVRLCERVYGLLDRVREGGELSPWELEAVRREAIRLGLERDPGAFRPVVAAEPVNLN